MSLPIRPVATIFLVALIHGCGGGGGGGGAGGAAGEPGEDGQDGGDNIGIVVNPGTPTDDPATVGSGAAASLDGACDRDFFRNAVGAWEGTIEYDRSNRDGSACTFETELLVSAEVFAGVCKLNAISESTVEQTVVADADSAAAAECLEGTSRFEITPPFEINPLFGEPVLVAGVDFDYSIRAGWDNGFEDDDERGPYFGDSSVIRDYVKPFTGSTFDSFDLHLEFYSDRIDYLDAFDDDGTRRWEGTLRRPGDPR